ncbi:hypothetical protein DXK94_13570 [Arthrobacter sp. RT-1]|uniref:hypothetical protein n=1 Tax=Arthrobacter sp. RT-1 TaxID=2292263 RepID=UPI000E1F4BE2|nr:hypothetical protein [Arthrobacter sp. RT-1]RDV09410.1 hypothetical protein DXK94_13570 [Arthrobacter sp. RT-1]
MNRHPRRKLTATVLGACLGVALLGGCSPAPDLDTAVAGQLQTRVASAKKLAAAQDFPSALAELQQMNQDVATAADQGKVSQQRKARIEAAISTIRSELEAALAPAPTSPATDRPLTKDEQERLEEAQKEAEKQREEAQKEAEKQLEEAQEQAEKQRKEAQEEAEKQRNRD